MSSQNEINPFYIVWKTTAQSMYNTYGYFDAFAYMNIINMSLKLEMIFQ